MQYAVPLKGVFFLANADQDQTKPVGVGQAVCLLAESAEQLWWNMSSRLTETELRAQRLQRFQNVCALAKSVPCCLLRISLTGRFWEKIEEALAGDGV